MVDSLGTMCASLIIVALVLVSAGAVVVINGVISPGDEGTKYIYIVKPLDPSYVDNVVKILDISGGNYTIESIKRVGRTLAATIYTIEYSYDNGKSLTIDIYRKGIVKITFNIRKSRIKVNESLLMDKANELLQKLSVQESTVPIEYRLVDIEDHGVRRSILHSDGSSEEEYVVYVKKLVYEAIVDGIKLVPNAEIEFTGNGELVSIKYYVLKIDRKIAINIADQSVIELYASTTIGSIEEIRGPCYIVDIPNTLGIDSENIVYVPSYIVKDKSNGIHYISAVRGNVIELYSLYASPLS